MSYIKPLNGSLGPKQTKCELKDEVADCDFDNYVSTVTTMRTPDVPSGGVFSVKTRTCIMWAGPISSKVLVTTQVEWTGRSFIKGEQSLYSSIFFLFLLGYLGMSGVVAKVPLPLLFILRLVCRGQISHVSGSL